ncbi:MAG: GGDEF domain-containing protein [Pseudobutyrivibrio sp.]|nr:GGDEF domain-containing protein [Pseudobutyrivibrio sp.]
MSLNINSPEVVELVNKIRAARGIDSLRQLDLCYKFYEMAQNDGTDDLKDIASCSLGEACCQCDDFTQSFMYLSAGITGLCKTDEYDLICRSFNEMGMCFQYQNNYINAFECYSASIDHARTHRLYILEAMACHNMASLCEEMEDFDQALTYRYRSLECLSLTESSDVTDEYSVIDMGCIVRLYVLNNDAEQAAAMFNSMTELFNKHPNLQDSFEVAITQLSYYHYINDAENEAKYKEIALKGYMNCQEYLIYFDEFVALSKYLLEARDFDNLQKVLDIYEEICVDDICTNQKMRVAYFKVKMYEMTGDREKMLENSYKYMKLDSSKHEAWQRSFQTTIRLYSELQTQRVNSLFMAAAADTDELTGIANRRKLNEVIDELFGMTYKNGYNLGVEMMDVDFFKQVNDNYGHSVGDIILMRVAEVLKKIQNDNIFVARYGGDEFIIYYVNMSDGAIMEKVAFIREEVEKIRLDMELSNLSVSQGIVNHVPISINRAWDYMMVADEALYYVKGNGKNNARLVHSLKELKDQSWEKPF